MAQLTVVPWDTEFAAETAPARRGDESDHLVPCGRLRPDGAILVPEAHPHRQPRGALGRAGSARRHCQSTPWWIRAIGRSAARRSTIGAPGQRWRRARGRTTTSPSAPPYALRLSAVSGPADPSTSDRVSTTSSCPSRLLHDPPPKIPALDSPAGHCSKLSGARLCVTRTTTA